MHGWQANLKRTCAQPVSLGLCPKLKYPPFYGGIFICFFGVLYVYAEDRTEAISLGELAQQCLADVTFESAEGYRNQVQEFYEADEDGWYELVQDTAYSPYSKEQQAALKQIVENADL